MIHHLTCIVCPNGCALTYDDKLDEVKGNKCPRGESFAKEEILAPKRNLTALVKTIYSNQPVVSVRLSNKILKKDIFQAMKIIDEIIIDHPMKLGDIIIENFLNYQDVDLILTKDVKGE